MFWKCMKTLTMVLKHSLTDIQEKLHNAKLFREKLTELDPDSDRLTDEGKLAKLQNMYENTELISFGNETPINKVKSEIIKSIQIYNTLDVCVYGSEYMILTVYTNAQPVLYYFKNELSNEDISEIISNVEEYCDKNDIGFRTLESSDN